MEVAHHKVQRNDEDCYENDLEGGVAYANFLVSNDAEEEVEEKG